MFTFILLTSCKRHLWDNARTILLLHLTEGQILSKQLTSTKTNLCYSQICQSPIFDILHILIFDGTEFLDTFNTKVAFAMGPTCGFVEMWF